MTFDTRDGADASGGPVLTEGWQPDPAVRGQERWFDGTRWTNMTRPAGGGPAPAAQAPGSTLAPPAPAQPQYPQWSQPTPSAYGGSPAGYDVPPSLPGSPPGSPRQWVQVRPVGDVFGSPGKAPSTGGLRGLAIAVAVLLVIGAAGVFVARQAAGPDYPDAWDPRVTAFVTFVEAERGQRFDHPVHVDFLPEEDFKAKAGSTEGLTDEERTEIEQYAGALRAVGLLSGEVDLTSMMSKLSGEATLGLYSHETERIWVRGSDLTPAVQATLVHELTHALQDQHYDLGQILDEATSDAAVRGLVEADANRIEEAFVETFAEADKQAYEQAQDDFGDEADLEGIPPVLMQSLGFPYVFGPAFVEALMADGGTIAVNRAFDRPPTSEADLLDPSRYLRNIPLDLPAKPPLAKGEKLVGADEEPDDFGQTTLVQIMANHVGYLEAWRVLQPWRGDRMAVFTEPSGRVCVAANVRFDSAEAAGQFAGVAATWAGAVKGAATHADRDVLLRACDPGGAAPALPPGPDGDAFSILVLRSGLITQSMQDHDANLAQATCLADGLVEVGGPARLARAMETDDASVWTGLEQQAFDVSVRCRSAA